jgi:hypothetical protein
MENHHFSWENPLLMAIFNSYVKLPEGRCLPSRNQTWQWMGDPGSPEAKKAGGKIMGHCPNSVREILAVLRFKELHLSRFI